MASHPTLHVPGRQYHEEANNNTHWFIRRPARATRRTAVEPATTQPNVVVWLRQDLRLHDNPALHRAAALASKRGGVVTITYIHSPEEDGDALEANHGTCWLLVGGWLSIVVVGFVCICSVYWYVVYRPSTYSRSVTPQQKAVGFSPKTFSHEWKKSAQQRTHRSNL